MNNYEKDEKEERIIGSNWVNCLTRGFKSNRVPMICITTFIQLSEYSIVAFTVSHRMDVGECISSSAWPIMQEQSYNHLKYIRYQLNDTQFLRYFYFIVFF